MNKVLTLSIAAYNVEKYLESLLESVMNCKSKQNIEVLVINDGSQDRTGEIADSYQNAARGIIYHREKENGGHGSTIMKGIKEASGDYFYVVDGDDLVNPVDLDTLVEELKKSNEDCILLDYIRKNEATGQMTKVKNGIGEEEKYTTLSFDDIADKALLRMPTMVVRTTILKEHDIVIDEHRYFTDKEYIYYTLPWLNSFKYLPLSVYIYRIGIVTQSMSIQGTRKHNPDREFISIQLIKFYEQSKDKMQKTKRDYLCKNIGYSYIATINGYMKFPWKDITIRKRLKDYDAKVNELSNEVYSQVYSDTSIRVKKLAILRRTQFYGWRTASLLGRIRRTF